MGAEAELAMDRALALRLAGGRWARDGDGSRGVEAGGMMQSTARGQANPSLHLTRACGAPLYRLFALPGSGVYLGVHPTRRGQVSSMLLGGARSG